MLTVFLDRDGVINRNRSDYVKSWSEFRFLPGARNALARLTQIGCRLFVVTNQACIGKGLVSTTEIVELHRRMLSEITLAGGRIEAVLCCPHRSDAGCDCRKPAPGLIWHAREQFHADLEHAVFIGDASTDIQAAAAAGLPAILVLSGLGWRTALHMTRADARPWQVVLNLVHAARLIGRDMAMTSRLVRSNGTGQDGRLRAGHDGRSVSRAAVPMSIDRGAPIVIDETGVQVHAPFPMPIIEQHALAASARTVTEETA